MERVGYLIDWELSCKRSEAMAHDRVSTIRLIALALALTFV